MDGFEEIRKKCLEKGSLWEDPEFQATQSSVFYHQTPPFSFEWKRPSEFVIDPIFIASECELTTGKLGDHWLASCLGCLRLTEGLLYRVVPADQNFYAEDGYAGIFRFRIWWEGEWQEVCVDDRLPTVKGQLVFINAKNPSQFWPALLEKAYAKLHGSYEALKYGTVLDGIADFTGGISESIPVKNDGNNNIMGQLENLLRMTTIVTCKIALGGSAEHRRDKLVNGITPGESYRVLSVEKAYSSTEESLRLLRLKTTSGSSAASNKDKSSSSSSSPDNTYPDIHLKKDEFLMPLAKWMSTFTHLEVVHLDSDTARDEPSLQDKIPWLLRIFHGHWRKGVTAGGCRNYPETFHLNPQLILVIGDRNDVVLSVTQNNSIEPQVIGFTGYSLKNEELDSLDTNKAFFKTKRSLMNSQYTNSRQVTLRSKLGEGSYLVLPTSYEPGQEATFIFRVLCRSSVRLKVHDSQPLLLKSPMVQAQETTKGLGHYQGLFLQVADEQKYVNAFELQELLEICLPNDYIKSCASLEVCRQVILAFDAKGFGKISFSEFKDLICSIKYWQNAFKSHTKEKTGILKADRLRDALMEVGFQLNSSIMGSLLAKYMRKDGTLRFGDFVAAILSLAIAFSLFKRKDQSQSGLIRLNQSEFIKMSLSC